MTNKTEKKTKQKTKKDKLHGRQQNPGVISLYDKKYCWIDFAIQHSFV